MRYKLLFFDNTAVVTWLLIRTDLRSFVDARNTNDNGEQTLKLTPVFDSPIFCAHLEPLR